MTSTRPVSCPWLRLMVTTAAIWMGLASCLASIRISEFLSANNSGLKDSDGEFSDWIEILNDGNASVNLLGWSLTDDPESTGKWFFPATNLPPNSYLVIFASGKDRRTPGSELHSNFSLDSGGEYLGLFSPEATVASSEFAPTYPRQSPDVSFGERAGSRFFFRAPTPGSANSAGIADYVADTKFSHNRGFYSNAFELSISSATSGATIRFTTNGTAPSLVNGSTYSQPLSIRGTTVIRASAFKDGFQPSTSDTHTYIFLDDVVRQSPSGSAPPGWPSSWGANTVNYGMDPDIVNSPAYKDTLIKDLQTLPSFCVTVRLGDLFDPSTGIYANPGQDGRDWERPCSLELVHPDGAAGFQINAGIRIRGGFSRSTSNPKHALRFFFRESYGEAKLRHPLFDGNATQEFDALDLRTFQNYSWSFQGDSQGVFIRDQFSRDTQLSMGQQGERGNYYHLYINGQYWGLFNTCERPEASYGATYFGGNKEDYDVIKVEAGPYTINATDGNLTAWTRLYNLLKARPVSDELYQSIQGLHPDGSINPGGENLLDIDNLIDYMLVILYGGNLDAPISNFLGNSSPNNWYGLRNRTGRFGGFRFISHDAEHTLLDINQDRTGPFTSGNDSVTKSNPQWLWQQLSTNPEFRLRVADHIQKHFFNRGALSVESALQRFNARRLQIDRAVVAESARWGDSKREPALTRENAWLPSINRIVNTYIPGRSAIVLKQLQSKNLFPSLAAPAFSSPSGSSVPLDAPISIAGPPNSTILYTTDGTDPRQFGGSISPTASSYSNPITLKEGLLIRSRAFAAGTWSPISEAVFTITQDWSSLRVSELMYHPKPLGTNDSDSLEYIELHNAGSRDLDLSWVQLTNAVEFIFPLGSRLSPGQFAVLVRNPDAFRIRYPNVSILGEYSGRFTDSGENLTLLSPSGSPILEFTYSDNPPWPSSADGDGFSLVPFNISAPGNLNSPSSWRPSSAVHGSPGATDPAPNIGSVFVNEILTHSDPPLSDFIELVNPGTTPVDISGWWLSDDRSNPKKFQLPGGSIVPAGGFLTFNESRFNTADAGTNAFTFNSHGDEAFLFSANSSGELTGWVDGFSFGAAANGVSFGRYTNSSGRLILSATSARSPGAINPPPLTSPVVINEILSNPNQGDIEFIEFLNTSNGPVNLFDPEFPTHTWSLGGVDFEFPPSTVLPANGYAVVCSGDPQAFRQRYGIPPATLVFGPYLGSLSDGGERLSLRRPDSPDFVTNGVVVQTFFPLITVESVLYSTQPPWPAVKFGQALERKSGSMIADDPASWSLSAFGTSPGGDNSGNRPPRVDAGPDQEILSQAYPAKVLLNAIASDDGLPLTPGKLTYLWTQTSGPSGAVFADATLRNPSVDLPGQGTFTFAVSVSDGNRSVSDSISVRISRSEGLATLLKPSGQWRYVDSGPEPAASWIQPGFDDSSWKTGTAEFGYSIGDDSDTQVTTLDFGGNPGSKRIAYHFRSHFSIGSASSVLSLTGRILRDDGAIVYLNGHEVIRDNMPEGPITAATRASNSVGGGDESSFFDRPIDASKLVDGDNVIAVEIHQNSPSSSDISFDFALVGSVSSTNRPPSVEAGPDLTTDFGKSLSLRGTFSDDGLPSNPGSPLFSWSKVSGPGTVSFEPANSPSSVAIFSLPGSYVLRFRVADGEFARTDELSVVVKSSNPIPAPVLKVKSSNPLILSFLAAPGGAYRLESRSNLGSGDWRSIATHPAGNERTIDFEVSLLSQHEFFRVVLVP